MKKSSQREKEAKDFESNLNEKNQKLIEKLFDSINEPELLSASFVRQALDNIIGDKATNFLCNLMDVLQLEKFLEINGISAETKKYLAFLWAKYANKLCGLLSGSLRNNPDSWFSVGVSSVKYDVRKKEPLLKLKIVKENREELVIEDPVTDWVTFSGVIVEHIIEQSSILMKFDENLGISKKDMKKLKTLVNDLDKIVSAK